MSGPNTIRTILDMLYTSQLWTDIPFEECILVSHDDNGWDKLLSGWKDVLYDNMWNDVGSYKLYLRIDDDQNPSTY